MSRLRYRGILIREGWEEEPKFYLEDPASGTTEIRIEDRLYPCVENNGIMKQDQLVQGHIAR